ncbi:MAG: tripartite tricarboxylate transporter permease, partial [Burkholderiaceae bacterium]
QSKDLVWTVFAAMFFANISILFLGYIQTKTVVHLLRIPFHLLAPGILLIATVGAYGLRNLVVDVWVMFIAGIVGFFLRRSGYSIAGIVLGLVLGELGESSFSRSMQLLDYSFVELLSRPIAGALIGLACLTMAYNIYSELRKRSA